MNKIIKNFLGLIGAAAILALAYAALSYVSYYGEMIQPSSFRSFSVSGEGKATAIPDVAEFSFQVINEGGTDIAALQSKNTETTNKVISFVKSQGVADKDIETQSYNVDPRYQTYDCRVMSPNANSQVTGSTISSNDATAPALAPDSINTAAASVNSASVCPPSSIVGYTITQSIDVKIRDFNKIGNIMGGIITNGANQVGSLSFTIDDPSQVQDQARAQAISKAKNKAEAIAQAGGFKIGRLLSIQEGSAYPVYNAPLMMTAAVKSTAGGASPSIQAGSQETDITMTLQYEIK